MNHELLERANANRAEVKRLIDEATELFPTERRKFVKITKTATIFGHSIVEGGGTYQIELTEDDLRMLCKARDERIEELNREFFAMECVKQEADW